MLPAGVARFAVTAAGTQDAQRLVIPASVQAVIESRLERLEPEARDFLNAVSVFRRGVEFDLAREVSGQEGEIVRTCINAPEGAVEIEL